MRAVEIIAAIILVGLGAAFAIGLKVQTASNVRPGLAGTSGASVASSALIEVLVTDGSGAGVTNLGASAGNQTSPVALPAGWTLRDLSVAPGGCKYTTTEFINLGDGAYSIRVVPFVGNPACKWLIGDYVYSVQIDKTVAGKTFKGGAIGTILIR